MPQWIEVHGAGDGAPITCQAEDIAMVMRATPQQRSQAPAARGIVVWKLAHVQAAIVAETYTQIRSMLGVTSDSATQAADSGLEIRQSIPEAFKRL